MDFNAHEIRSVLITPKNGMKVKFIQTGDPDGIATNETYNYSNDRVPHSQLFSTFRFLMAHAAIIGDLVTKDHKIDAKYIKNRSVINDASLISYRVLGFTLKEDMNGETVQLTLEKKLPKGGTYEIKLPFVRLYGESDYEFSGNLVEDLRMCLDEVVEYKAGKYQESTQYSMQLDADDEQF